MRALLKLINNNLSQLSLYTVVTGAVLAIGIYEAASGWLQLLEMKPSLHARYPVTGSFYNPGPYCCFLAVVIPLAVGWVIETSYKAKRYIGVLFLLLSVSLMPVLMGRTGWIAAFVGLVATVICTRRYRMPSKRILLIISALLILAAWVLYNLKPASAIGRIFLWKIGFEAMLSHPLEGVGWYQVPGALAEAQEKFFLLYPMSSFSNVAGSPEYAFNEYLQIAIAFGIGALLLFISLLLLSIYTAWKGKKSGLTGSLVSLGVVCFGSYPFMFGEFIIVTLLLFVASMFASGYKLFPAPIDIVVTISVFIISVTAFDSLQAHRAFDNEWSVRRNAYRTVLNEKDMEYLDSLVSEHDDNARLLFDYGKMLRENGYYKKSNEILLKGTLVSSDPMFLNLLGRNFFDMGDATQAEECYLRSASLLPNRLYPYYLLCKLYGDSIVGDKTKFLSAYETFVEREPKVMSPAVKQMREELKNLYISMYPDK